MLSAAKQGVMSKMEKPNLKLILGLIVLFGLAIFMLISSFNITLSETFIYSSRRVTYCFSGINRIVIALSLLFWGLFFLVLSSFGALYISGLVKKPISLPDKYILPPMVTFTLAAILSLTIAQLNCD